MVDSTPRIRINKNGNRLRERLRAAMNFFWITSNFYDIKRESLSAKNTVKREFIFIVQIYPSFVSRLTKFFYLFMIARREIFFERRTDEIFPGARHKFRFLRARSRAERGKKKRDRERKIHGANPLKS